jgi:DNA polymerase-3 subunit beta
MKLELERDILLNGIQTVQNVISSKAALPILSHLLIETQEEQLKLTATDLDIGISCVINAKIQEQGAITVPAKRFSDIVKELPMGAVDITTKKK